MSISSGTYTFGTGGTYSTLGAALADLATPLTGNVTFNQVGDSTDASAIFPRTGSGIDLGGFALTIRQATSHLGSPLNPYVCRFPSLNVSRTGVAPRGSFVMEDLYCIMTPPSSGTGIFVSTMSFIPEAQVNKFINCIFVCTVSNATNVSVSGPTSSGDISTGKTWTLQVCNNKFYGGQRAFNFNASTTTISGILATKILVENNAFVVSSTSASSSIRAVNFGLLVGTPFTRVNTFNFRNNVCWLQNSSQAALSFGDNGSLVYSSVLTSLFFNNAKNTGIDLYNSVSSSLPGWFSTAITSPADILNLDPSLAGFGETNPLSSLFINGSAPSLAFNPYTSSPYPIGLHYASGTGGGAEAPTLTAPFYNTDKYFSGDLALAFQNDEISIDVSLNDADRDPSIISAILISLLTDKRAAEYDTLPSEDSDRRGWWADAFQADNIGSKLWLLERSKVTSEVLAKFKHYTKEALDWMIEDGIATDIEVDATIVSPDAISLEVMIFRPRDPLVKYIYNWETSLISKGN